VVFNKTEYPPKISIRILIIGLAIGGRDDRQAAPFYLVGILLFGFGFHMICHQHHVLHQEGYILKHIVIDSLQQVIWMSRAGVYQTVAVIDVTPGMIFHLGNASFSNKFTSNFLYSHSF